MGAVQKLATIVIVGLTGLATLLVFLLADETFRRDAKADEHDAIAIERGVQTYVTNCLVCHGPAGEGALEPGRAGVPIGGNSEARLANQSTDPVIREQREQQIRTRIHGGSPIGCSSIYPDLQCAMPPWGNDYGGELNNEQIEELVLMVQNVDWDYVYNEAIAANNGEYPAPPEAPSTDPDQEEEAGEESGAAIRLEGFDIGWRTADQPGPQVDLTLPPGAIIDLVNVGAGPHNFQADDLGINEDMPVGYSGQITIPADALPGTYDFICNVPGHAPIMFGTITVDPNAVVPGGEDGAAPPEASPDATPEGSPAATPAAEAETVRIEGFDIGWQTADQAGPQVTLEVAPGATIELVNVGVGPHNFQIDALGINEDMPVGYSGTVTIPDDTPPGEYEFICNVPGHAAIMYGTLIVQ